MVQISKQFFGEHQGQEVSLYSLTNKNGLKVCVTDFGCIVTQLWVPDRQGVLEDIVLGFDDLASYQAKHPFFGAIAGRCANRIADGKFVLQGKEYQLACNELATNQHLHGGELGFDKRVWQSTIEDNGVVFSLVSSDGDQGYPGTLSVKHRISLNDNNVITFDYTATSDKTTLVNLTNHSYYNLSGFKQDIRHHQLQIDADFITPVDPNTLVPTGEVIRIQGTEFDFNQPRYLGEAMDKRPNHDFDINYVLNKAEKSFGKIATVTEPNSGRVMEVYSDQPGVQLYNGFKLSNKTWLGKNNQLYGACSGLCLETQAFPDSINKPHFPSVLLEPDQCYQHHTEYRFTVFSNH